MTPGRPRLGILHVWHEVNTFSSRRPTLSEFEAFELVRGDALVRRHLNTSSVVGGFLDAGDVFELVPLAGVGTWPSGPADASTADAILQMVDDTLAGAARLDGVLLSLHGAMCSDGHPDMDGTVVQMVRRRIGEGIIGCVLDPHANPSPSLIDGCDAVIAYDTYPHVDMRARGREVAELARASLDGTTWRTVGGRTALLTCPVAQATASPPMLGLIERARARAQARGIARVSLLPGFAYADVERAGFSVLAVGRDDQQTACAEVVGATLEDVDAHAAAFSLRFASPQDACREAVDRDDAGLTVLVDVGDNIGAGGSGDGTALLAGLLERSARDAVVTLADADVVAEALRAGEGGHVDVLVGGKRDRLHGEPVHIEGTIAAIHDGTYRGSGTYLGGQTFHMGRSCRIDLDGVVLIVTERATPPRHPEQLTMFGVDLAKTRILTTKGAVAWRTVLGDVAAEPIFVDTPGVVPVDPWTLPRTTTPIPISPGALT